MAVLAAGVVSRWGELATGELRERVQQLVAARLDADHAVWKTIRRDPVLTARVRGVLSGMATSVHGTRDEHMRRVWITAARNALENTPPAPPAPVRRPRVAPPVPDLLVETASGSTVAKPTAKLTAEHEPVEPAEPADAADPGPDTPAVTEDPVQPAFTSAPPPVTPITASPRAPIPPMVFSGP